MSIFDVITALILLYWMVLSLGFLIDPIRTARIHGWLNLVNAVGNSLNQRLLLLRIVGFFFFAGGLYAWFVFLRTPRTL